MSINQLKIRQMSTQCQKIFSHGQAVRKVNVAKRNTLPPLGDVTKANPIKSA